MGLNTVDEIAKLLDEKEPDWYERIDLGKLDLSHYENCILGQLYGDFYTGEAYQIRLTSGLDLTPLCSNDYASEWVHEIKNRLNNDKQPTEQENNMSAKIRKDGDRHLLAVTTEVPLEEYLQQEYKKAYTTAAISTTPDKDKFVVKYGRSNYMIYTPSGNTTWMLAILKRMIEIVEEHGLYMAILRDPVNIHDVKYNLVIKTEG